MADQLFIDLPHKASLDKPTDYLHVISASGDKIMSYYDFLGMVVDGEYIVRDNTTGNVSFITGTTPPYALKCVLPRGKNLGSAPTAAQSAAIANNTFKDMFVGDYWLNGGIKYYFAHPNYWLHNGDTPCETPHVQVVPEIHLYSEKMNDANTTEGGYIGSKMYKTGLNQAKTMFANVFGSNHILTHRELLTNAVTNGKPSSGAWVDSTVELMNELMVYASHILTPANDGVNIPYLYTIDKTQIALFRLFPELISAPRTDRWLRDVVSGAYFALVRGHGNANYAGASYALGVWPACGIR